MFVTVENAQTYGSKLYALSARTGKTDWSASLGGTYGFSALAYDRQRVFAINWDGRLSAFAAGRGRRLWSVVLGSSYQFTAPPTAYAGVVYLPGTEGVGGGVLFAVSEASGRVNWTRGVVTGGNGSPAADASGVYLSYSCQQAYHFALSGHLVWHHHPGCQGGGGTTPALHGGSVYARGSGGDTPLILSDASGHVTGSFASDTAPAFGGSTMYTLQQGKVVAVAAAGRPDRWTSGVGSLVTAPVASGGVVFAGSASGKVYGLSARSGKRVWSGTAGSVILGPDEQNADVLIGIAVGDGMLVVPAGRQVTAFGS